MKRAERRYKKELKVKIAKKLYPQCECPQKYADNLTPCSCAACGNPRRIRGDITRQESMNKENKD